MSVKVIGMQELIDQLSTMEKVGEETADNALKKAGEYVKDVEVDVAKKTHKKYSEKVGYKEIKQYPIKKGKLGSKYANIGIRANVTASQRKREEADASKGIPRATHWDKIRGLWFNNYGFFHNITGEYIAGSDWIGTAYDRSVEKAYDILRTEIEKGLKL